MGVAGIDLTLYVILDKSIEDLIPIERFVSEVIAGGATCLQVRCKEEGTRDILSFTRTVLEIAADANIPVIVNDRVDIALAVGARGVHVGEEDMPVEDVRRICGEELVVGASARDVESARAAQAAGAGYLGVGPMFPSPVKPDVHPVGPERIAEIRKEISLPIVAIGGINDMNVALPLQCGADGVAVISALRQCKSPKEAASRLRAAIEKARKR
jgi:thiamine-phosphate pyrophosphorylase